MKAVGAIYKVIFLLFCEHQNRKSCDFSKKIPSSGLEVVLEPPGHLKA